MVAPTFVLVHDGPCVLVLPTAPPFAVVSIAKANQNVRSQFLYLCVEPVQGPR